ncbi:calcium-binding protein [Stieleria varia]|uniref:Hemolysin, chromosomal n=1 Tax=Stieleria varia TaxID=2528005 RepID=A0A5C6AGX5_9BACT|nr:calcium-binding protein [Stieleria varia]TWT98321.1 Hemolysin, chromosomal [Stieleria varia]
MSHVLKSFTFANIALLVAAHFASAGVSIDRDDRVLIVSVDDPANEVQIVDFFGDIRVDITRYDTATIDFGQVSGRRDRTFSYGDIDRVEVFAESFETRVLYLCDKPVSVVLGDGRNNLEVFGASDVQVLGGDGPDFITIYDCENVDIDCGDSVALGNNSEFSTDLVYVLGARQAVVDGGAGDDTIRCGFLDNYREASYLLDGVEFALSLDAELPGRYIVRGGEGDDDIIGAEDRANVGSQMFFYGDDGDDHLTGAQQCYNRLDGGADDDVLVGGKMRDALYGRDGADQLIGCQENRYEPFSGGDGNPVNDGFDDEMHGGSGPDRFYGEIAETRTQLVTEKRIRFQLDRRTGKLVAKSYNASVLKRVEVVIETEKISDLKPTEGDENIRTVLN